MDKLINGIMKTHGAILCILVNIIPVFVFCQNPEADTTTAEYRMISAVKTGDSLTFDKLLKTNPSMIDIKEPIMEESLLHVAARFNQYGMVRKLLGKGLDVNAKNKLGSIPLHLACMTGSYPMVNDLLIRGSDYSVVNSRGKTPVAYVSYGKNPELFKLFLAKDRNILNTKSTDGTNLLFFAIYAGDTAGFSFLLKHGLNINSKDGHHFTPLFWAVRDNNSERITYLIKHGANVNSVAFEGNTPVLFAIEIGDITTVSVLVNAGADITIADSLGLTGLHKSAINGFINIASYLIKKGVPLDSKDKNGMTALHYAAIYGHSEIGRALILKGADPNIEDKQQHAPVWYSTYYGNRNMTELLLTSGAKKTDLKVRAYEKNLKPGDAVVHYLNHSGYAIETSGHLLVFDYFHYYAPPDNLSILNGRIDPGQLPAKKIIVFCSHEHGDHYDTTIWKWDSPKNNIQYVMGFKPEVKHPYVFIEPRQEKQIGDVHINAIKSSDAGVGFLVEADGIIIYHPGDHVNKSAGLDRDFKNEIDWLAGLKKSVDIAFFPVAGCGFPDLEVVKEGNFYVEETLKPAISFAMHADAGQCMGFSKEVCLKYPGVQTEYGKFPGDRFIYRKNNKNTSLNSNSAVNPVINESK
jgi:ankyrin repeat protein/L-ascorbate metabolism protein UlaG (beta-lactamase superfamily)